MTPPDRPSADRDAGPFRAASRPGAGSTPPPPAARAYADRGGPAAQPTAAPDPVGVPAADREWSTTATAVPTGALAGRGGANTQAAVSGLASADAEAAARAAAASRTADRDAREDDGRAVGRAVPVHRGPRPDHVPVRRRPLPGGLHLGQLVAAEIAVGAVVATHRQPLGVAVPVAAAAVLVLVLSLVRLRGRWAYQWADLWLRHRFSRRRRTLPDAARPIARAESLLDTVVRGGWLGEVDLDGVPAALWAHDGGLSVALEVTVLGERPHLTTSRPLPPVTALLPAADEGGTRFTVQVLEQVHVPSPGAGPAALSYRELTGGAVPAVRRTWVALQVLRGPEDESARLQVELANATRRVVRRLHRAGLRATPLGADDAVVGLLGLLGPASADGRVHERWSGWSAGSRRHLTAVLEVPGPGAAPLLPAALDELRARALATPTTTVVGVAARRVDDAGLDVQVTVRATLPDAPTGAPVESAVAELLSGAVRGVRLHRLDGRHRTGVAATLPLGGFLR